MKPIAFFCLFFLSIVGTTFAQQITSKIGTESFYIDPSAALEVQSNSKGFLPPRLTTTERNNIVDPATGLVIFNNTTKQLETNIGTTTAPVWSGNAPDATASAKGIVQLGGDLAGVGSAAAAPLISAGAITTAKIAAGAVDLTTKVTGLLPGANGGTGVNNGTKTITLGGNLTTSGAFDTTLTSTAATNVTLPTTGTLATLTGTETLTNKTLTAPVLTASPLITDNSTAVASTAFVATAVAIGAPDATTTIKGKIQLAGDLSGTADSPVVTNTAVMGKVLTGFTSGTVVATVSATDNILQAFQKIDGNVALKAPINSPALTGIPTAPSAAVGTSTTQIATTEFVNKTGNLYIPTSQYPSFSSSGFPILIGALWVGYDATLGVWKYYKQVSGRGLSDPGNPSGWVVDGGAIGVFNGDLSILPSGTHINFKYDPRTKAAIYNKDDIAVRLGNLWVDKYEARIIDVSTSTFMDNDIDSPSSPAADQINGNGQKLPNSYLSFSQKNNGSSGVSWYGAQVALSNNDKRLLTNSEWQVAASGTEKSDATGGTDLGENWSTVNDLDISRYGIVGCVGSLWEWVADLGHYGPSLQVANNYTIQNQDGVDTQTNVHGAAFTNNTKESTTGSYMWIASRAAIARGGAYNSGTGAGAFAVSATFAPSSWWRDIGFRGVRQ